MEFDKTTRSSIRSKYSRKLRFFKINHCLLSEWNYINFLETINKEIIELENRIEETELMIKLSMVEEWMHVDWCKKYNKAILYELNKIKKELIDQCDFFIISEVSFFKKLIEKNHLELKKINFFKKENQ